MILDIILILESISIVKKLDPYVFLSISDSISTDCSYTRTSGLAAKAQTANTNKNKNTNTTTTSQESILAEKLLVNLEHSGLVTIEKREKRRIFLQGKIKSIVNELIVYSLMVFIQDCQRIVKLQKYILKIVLIIIMVVVVVMVLNMNVY